MKFECLHRVWFSVDVVHVVEQSHRNSPEILEDAHCHTWNDTKKEFGWEGKGFVYRLFNTARNFDSWPNAELVILRTSSLNKINSDRIERKLVFSFPLDCQRAIIACKKKKNRESKSLLSITGRRERRGEEGKICSNYILLSTESKPYGNEYDSPTNLIRRKNPIRFIGNKHQSFREENSLFALDLSHHYGWKEIFSDRRRGDEEQKEKDSLSED